MRISILTTIMALALPLLALGQTAEPQQSQTQTQEQDKQPAATAPTKEKQALPAQERGKAKIKPDTAKPETTGNVPGQTDVQGRGRGMNKAETGSTTSQTKVNVQEFKSRHSEVFSLGRHPKGFFIQKFGDTHFRLIGNTYFVFVDNCWVSVDVDGFTYIERVICPGDPEFVVVD